MNNYEGEAHSIIDMVLDAIEDDHPDLIELMIEKYDDIESPDILSGDRYWKLVEDIASELRNITSTKSYQVVK